MHALAALLPLLAAPSLPDDPPEAVALTIRGEPVSVEDFTRWLVRFRGEARAVDFVEMWTLEREAERLGIEVTEEEVRERVDQIVADRIESLFGGDRSRWVREIQNEKRSVGGVLAEMGLSVRAELLGERILQRERAITDEILRRAWEYHYGRGGHTIDARVIEIEVEIPPAKPAATLREIQAARQEAIDRAEVEANAVRDEIHATNNFAAAARKHSVHESAARGGSFVSEFKAGEWSADVLDPLEAVPAGKLSKPIFGMGSWWLFQVDDVRQTPFESVKEELREMLLAEPPTQEEFGLLFARLAGEATWEVKPAMWAGPFEDLSDEDVVLVIDGTPIRRGEYSDWLRVFNGEVIAPRFVEAFVIEREAMKREISIPHEELLARIEEEKTRRFLESGHTTRESWFQSMPGRQTDESVTRDMLVSHVAFFLAEDMLRSERVVTDADVRARWERDYGPGGKSLDARFIRLKIADARPPRGSSEEVYAELQKIYLEKMEVAEEIFERLDNGEDFGALARKYSDDETRVRGGETEGGFRSTDWPETVRDALLALEVGECTEPLEVGASLFIFELLEYRYVPLEDVAAEIRKELVEERPTIPDLAQYRNVLVRDVPFTVETALAQVD